MSLYQIRGIASDAVHDGGRLLGDATRRGATSGGAGVARAFRIEWNRSGRSQTPFHRDQHSLLLTKSSHTSFRNPRHSIQSLDHSNPSRRHNSSLAQLFAPDAKHLSAEDTIQVLSSPPPPPPQTPQPQPPKPPLRTSSDPPPRSDSPPPLASSPFSSDDLTTTSAYNSVMAAFLQSQDPSASVTPILKLYSELLSHPTLVPDSRTYELILSALTRKEEETQRQLRKLQHRITADTSKLEELRKADYLGAAQRIFGALGAELSEDVSADMVVKFEKLGAARSHAGTVRYQNAKSASTRSRPAPQLSLASSATLPISHLTPRATSKRLAPGGPPASASAEELSPTRPTTRASPSTPSPPPRTSSPRVQPSPFSPSLDALSSTSSTTTPAPATPESLPSSPARPPSNPLSAQLVLLFAQNKYTEAHSFILFEAAQDRFPDWDNLLIVLRRIGHNDAHVVPVDDRRPLYALATSRIPRSSKTGSSKTGSSKTAFVQLESEWIIQLLEAGLVDEANSHRQRLLDADLAPSAQAYAALIVQSRRKDASDFALALWEEARTHGVNPKASLANAVLEQFARDGRSADALKFLTTMQSETDRQRKPTSQTFALVIAAACAGGDVEAALRVLRELLASTLKPTPRSFDILLEHLTTVQPDRKKALEVYDAMTAAQVPLSSATYHHLLAAYGSCGETPDYASLDDVFATLEADPKINVSGGHWAQLILARGVAGRDLEWARRTFDEFKTHATMLAAGHNVRQVVLVYVAMLKACLVNGRADLCGEYLEEMSREGVKVTSQVALTVIEAHSAMGDLPAARAVFDSLHDAPSTSSPSTTPPSPPPSPPTSKEELRDSSHWELMVRCEVAASESDRARALLERALALPLPIDVLERIRGIVENVKASPAGRATSEAVAEVEERW